MMTSEDMTNELAKLMDDLLLDKQGMKLELAEIKKQFAETIEAFEASLSEKASWNMDGWYFVEPFYEVVKKAFQEAMDNEGAHPFNIAVQDDGAEAEVCVCLGLFASDDGYEEVSSSRKVPLSSILLDGFEGKGGDYYLEIIEAVETSCKIARDKIKAA